MGLMDLMSEPSDDSGSKDRNQKKQFKYYYQAKIKMIMGKKEPYEIETIQNIVISNDYHENFFSILGCNILLPPEKALILKENTNNTYFNVEFYLKKYKFEEQKSEDKEIKPYKVDLLFNRVFAVFLDRAQFPTWLTKDNLKKDESSDDKSYTNNPLRSNPLEISVILYDVNGLTLNKMMINAVLANSSKDGSVRVGTALNYILHSAKQQDKNIKAIVDVPDNANDYKEIILPPHNLRNSIYDLQVRYGIYGFGLSVFYDFGTLYILNKYSTNHEYKENTYNKCILNIYTSPGFESNPIGTCVEKDKNTLMYNFMSEISVSGQDELVGETFGDVTLFSNYGMTHNAVQYDEKGKFKEFNPPVETIIRPGLTHANTGTKVSFEYDELNNAYNIAEAMVNLSQKDRITIERIPSIYIDSIKPNTTVTINFPTSIEYEIKYGGTYCIAQANIIFNKENAMSDHLSAEAYKVVLFRR